MPNRSRFDFEGTLEFALNELQADPASVPPPQDGYRVHLLQPSQPNLP
jgi:hypothetical protein